MKKQICVILTLLFSSCVFAAKHSLDDCIHDYEMCVLKESGGVYKSFLAPSRPIPLENFNMGELRLHAATLPTLNLFEIEYDDATPLEAKAAIQYALSLWEQWIFSEVKIVVEVEWTEEDSEGTLASANAKRYPFIAETPQIPDHYAPVAIGNRKSRFDRYTPFSDIRIKVYGSKPFYYGIDGDCPTSRYDLVSIILHEVGHGLGFLSTAYEVEEEEQEDGGTTKASWGFGTSGRGAPFDYFVENLSGEKMVDSEVFENETHEALEYLTSQNIYFNSSIVRATYDSKSVKLWAPSEWDGGSSISHLDEITYRPGNPNSLMSPYLSKGEAIHDPGTLTMAILEEIGWDHLWYEHAGQKDTEDLTTTVRIETKIVSDSPLKGNPIISTRSDTTAPFVENEMHIDPVSNSFIGEIPQMGISQKWEYFITTKDEHDRTFYFPTKGSTSPSTFNVGEDLMIPELFHEPASFLLASENRFTGSFLASDNSSLGQLTIEWWLDGVPQENINLPIDPNASEFKFDQPIPDLEKHQLVEYRVFAIDASQARNGTVRPMEGKYRLPIKKLLPATNRYSTVFFENDADFILDGFEIKKTPGFDDLYLGTPHPYFNNGDHIEYYAYFRRPFIVEAKATINFFEVVLVEPGEEGKTFDEDGFYDYAVVEISKDNGRTWVPITDGWDSTSKEVWKTAYNNEIVEQISTAIGSKELFKPRVIQLDDSILVTHGDVVLIRFHLHSDPYDTGWGWAIDNFSIGVH